MPFDALPSQQFSVFMEITQIHDVTIGTMKCHLLAVIDTGPPFFHVLQPTDSFHFATIQRIYTEDGMWRWDSPVVSIYIGCNANGGDFVATVVHPLHKTELHGTNFSNSLTTLSGAYAASAISSSVEDSAGGRLYPFAPDSIKSLFGPKNFVLFMVEGNPLLYRLYPFGAIGNCGGEGIANYVIYFEYDYEGRATI